MLDLIIQNLANIIVGAVVLVIIAAVTIKMLNDKRNNKSSCSCGCSGCTSAANCGSRK